MDTEKLKKKLILRDRVVRVLSNNEKIRAVAVKNTTTAQTAQKRHNLDFAPAVLLAKSLSAASLMASFLKGEERISLEITGNGPINRIFAEALQVGEVRGFATQKEDINAKELDSFSDLLGVGFLKVNRILYNKPEPVQGIIDLKEGDIQTDIAYYYTQSEQTPTSVLLDVKLDNEGNIIQSGGIMIQAMPDASEEDLLKVYNNVKNIGRFSDLLNDELMPEDIISKVLPFDYEVLNSRQVDFFCRCSKKRFVKNLLTFDHNTIVDMEKKGENELVCKYCNEKYILTPADFKKLKEDTMAKRN